MTTLPRYRLTAKSSPSPLSSSLSGHQQQYHQRHHHHRRYNHSSRAKSLVTNMSFFAFAAAAFLCLVVTPQASLALQTTTMPMALTTTMRSHHHGASSSLSCFTTTSSSSCKTTTLSTGRISKSSYSSRSTKSSTALFLSSPDNSLVNPEENNNNKNNNKKSPKKWLTSIFAILLNFIKNIKNTPSKIRSYYGKLSKKGKLLLGVQLMALGMIMGVGYKTATKREVHRPVEVGYSTFLDLVDVNGKGHTPGKNPALKLSNVILSKDRIHFRVETDTIQHSKALLDKKLVQSNDVSVRPITYSEKTIYARVPTASQTLMETLRENGVPFRAASTKGQNTVGNITRISILVIYMLFLRRMYQAMGGGGGGAGGGMGSGAPGKLATFNSDEPLVKFEDIEGIDDAKFEVMELVDTLRNPKKYEILGARAPTGLLLEGPPGTGKTMLARATAATAGVPLLYCSGSDFVEMFVGRGAARVRNTFARAQKLSPCIIFIDELDALGKSRDMGGLGASMRSNDEAEQTLNQLLACMDGLDSSRRVCVLAATNRREILDPALIRPGRFDRIIKVSLPDVKGRERILRVHAKKLPGFTECKGVDEKRPGSLGKGASVDLSAVAAVTKGLCGADLEFIVNEAAIRAVRRVSSKLRAGDDPKSITPTVSAEDFENSVVDFYETRKPKGGVSDLLNNVLRT